MPECQCFTWDSFICMLAKTCRKPTTASHSLLWARLCWFPIHGPWREREREREREMERDGERERWGVNDGYGERNKEG